MKQLLIWLQIENQGKAATWFLPVGFDPYYFSPLEFAYPYHRAFQTAYNREVDPYFHHLSAVRLRRSGDYRKKCYRCIDIAALIL